MSRSTPLLAVALAAGFIVVALDRTAVAQRGQAAADAWAAENKMALQIMRERIEQHGVIGEDFRTW